MTVLRTVLRAAFGVIVLAGLFLASAAVADRMDEDVELVLPEFGEAIPIAEPVGEAEDAAAEGEAEAEGAADGEAARGDETGPGAVYSLALGPSTMDGSSGTRQAGTVPPSVEPTAPPTTAPGEPIAGDGVVPTGEETSTTTGSQVQGGPTPGPREALVVRFRDLCAADVTRPGCPGGVPGTIGWVRPGVDTVPASMLARSSAGLEIQLWPFTRYQFLPYNLRMSPEAPCRGLSTTPTQVALVLSSNQPISATLTLKRLSDGVSQALPAVTTSPTEKQWFADQTKAGALVSAGLGSGLLHCFAAPVTPGAQYTLTASAKNAAAETTETSVTFTAPLMGGRPMTIIWPLDGYRLRVAVPFRLSVHEPRLKVISIPAGVQPRSCKEVLADPGVQSEYTGTGKDTPYSIWTLFDPAYPYDRMYTLQRTWELGLREGESFQICIGWFARPSAPGGNLGPLVESESYMVEVPNAMRVSVAGSITNLSRDTLVLPSEWLAISDSLEVSTTGFDCSGPDLSKPLGVGETRTLTWGSANFCDSGGRSVGPWIYVEPQGWAKDGWYTRGAQVVFLFVKPCNPGKDPVVAKCGPRMETLLLTWYTSASSSLVGGPWGQPEPDWSNPAKLPLYTIKLWIDYHEGPTNSRVDSWDWGIRPSE